MGYTIVQKIIKSHLISGEMKKGEEIALLTPMISEREFEDELARLGASGARLQAHIRVLD